MTVIKKEITKKPTPEELKEGYREWTPENDRKKREKRVVEEGYVTLDGGTRSIELMKKLEIEDHEKGE